jgi:hypothetical protein
LHFFRSDGRDVSVIRIDQARSRGFLIRAGAFSRHGIVKETPINGARKSGLKVQKPTHEIFPALAQ